MNKLLIAIIFIAAFLRFWQLGVVPSGVTNDELGYIYNAYSIAKTGKNVFGEFLPFLTWVNQGSNPFLPVPIYFSVPFFWLFDASATIGRLPAALLGVADVFLLYVLVKQIFHKTPLALVSAFFLSISPWHLHFSRSAYDSNFALFFYLVGMTLFIYEVKKGRLPIFSSLSFLFAIFSYRGMNIIFPPLVVLLVWYSITVLKISRRQITAFLIGVILIVSSLLLVIVMNGASYTAEVAIWNNPKMQEELDIQIREAQGPLFVRRLFLNKPAYIISKLRENYIKGYSPEFLLLYTEPNKIFSIWSRGRIYFFDVVLIVLGIAYLYKTNKRGAFFVTSMLLIGGLPGMVSGLPYSARNFFIAAFLPIVSAGGATFLSYNFFSLKKLKVFIVFILILSYSYLLGSYLFDYYGRYALYGGEAWFKNLKDVSSLLIENRQRYKTFIVGTSSFGDLLHYAFYSKINPSEVQQAWRLRKKDGNEYFSVGNITFTTACLEDMKGNLPLFKESKPLLYMVHESCDKYATPSAMIRDYPGNIVWKIYNIND